MSGCLEDGGARRWLREGRIRRGGWERDILVVMALWDMVGWLVGKRERCEEEYADVHFIPSWFDIISRNEAATVVCRFLMRCW